MTNNKFAGAFSTGTRFGSTEAFENTLKTRKATISGLEIVKDADAASISSAIKKAYLKSNGAMFMTASSTALCEAVSDELSDMVESKRTCA
ncbi:MAG: hypothetical protein RSC52_02355 [Oscillospiraceae bacterium]